MDFKGADVASSATITPSGNVFHVTGTTGITSVAATSVPPGTRITIIFDGALTVTDGSNLKLNGNFVTAAESTLTLEWDGANWYELTRSPGIAKDTGWTAGTGTANKGAFATYAGQDVSATYVEAEAQATDDAVKANSQRIKALEDALRALLLIN